MGAHRQLLLKPLSMFAISRGHHHPQGQLPRAQPPSRYHLKAWRSTCGTCSLATCIGVSTALGYQTRRFWRGGNNLMRENVRVAASQARSRGLRCQSQLAIDIVSENPLIWVVDGLCTADCAAELKRLLEQQDMDKLRKTDAYIDDMFDKSRALREDAHLVVSMLQNGSYQFVPEAYQTDPLRSFLWVAAKHRERLTSGDMEQGCSAVARRAWCTQWDPEDLKKSGFQKTAARWQVPQPMLRCLSPLVEDILGARVRGLPTSQSARTRRSNISWVLRDTTVVRYHEGESQVPHIDTSDFTMLIYLSEGGGHTCFPNLNLSIPPSVGRVLMFSSTTPLDKRFGGFAGTAYGMPNNATMHYGGLPQDHAGEKLIVQLLFAALDDSITVSNWREVLLGDAVKSAAYSNGQLARPIQYPRVLDGSRRGPELVLSTQRCATGCKDMAVDLETEPGEQKYCIHCWQKRLEKMNQ